MPDSVTLTEVLSLRADHQSRLEQLKQRVLRDAKVLAGRHRLTTMR
jgi:hypothetical protein